MPRAVDQDQSARDQGARPQPSTRDREQRSCVQTDVPLHTEEIQPRGRVREESQKGALENSREDGTACAFRSEQAELVAVLSLSLWRFPPVCPQVIPRTRTATSLSVGLRPCSMVNRSIAASRCALRTLYFSSNSFETPRISNP